jgi:hypothetical protein
MPTEKVSLPAVTAAGIVAIIFSALLVFGSLLGGLSLLVMPDLSTTPGTPAVPPETRAMSAVMMFFMFLLAVFGIFVGTGILRRRNWARITILVWGGFMTLVCLVVLAFSFVIFGVMQTQLPNTSGVDTETVMRFTRIFLFVFYGIPAGVGIWWLILFTRKKVSDAFTSPPPAFAPAPVMDASGFPHLPAVAPVQLPKPPTCPLPLAILAGFYIFSSFFTLIFALIPIPYSVPLYLFGHVYSGGAPKIFLGFMAVVMGLSGVAILKLKPWGLHTLIAAQCVFFVNGLLGVLSPTYKSQLHDALEKLSAQASPFPGGNPVLSEGFFWPMMIFGLVFGALMIAFLLFFRSRFLEQAAAAAKA